MINTKGIGHKLECHKPKIQMPDFKIPYILKPKKFEGQMLKAQISEITLGYEWLGLIQFTQFGVLTFGLLTFWAFGHLGIYNQSFGIQAYDCNPLGKLQLFEAWFYDSGMAGGIVMPIYLLSCEARFMRYCT